MNSNSSLELYQDLEDDDNSRMNINANEILKLEKKCSIYENRIKSLENELKELNKHNKQILLEKEQLEKNMVIVYDTAMLEINRKNKELNSYRNNGVGINM